MRVDLLSMRVAYVHASVPAATWAATCWECEQLPRYWKPVQLQRATPSSTVTVLNSPESAAEQATRTHRSTWRGGSQNASQVVDSHVRMDTQAIGERVVVGIERRIVIGNQPTP